MKRTHRSYSRAAASLAVAGLTMTALGAGSLGAQVAHYSEIEYPPLADFVIPTPEIYELDNGLKVFLMEDHELPLISVVARIRVGSIDDPADKIGRASLMGVVQRSGGSHSMPADEMDDFLEARAASVETSVGETVGFASMNCLVDDFEAVFDVFHDVLLTPAFPEDRIEIAKAQVNSGIARRNDDVGSITGREYRRLVYGADSALGAMEEYATIAAIGKADLEALHADFYHPNNVYLGVTGDFDSADMKRKIEAVFGGWERGPAAGERSIDYRRQHSGGVYFIDKPDVTQANVRLGHLGITYDNPDYFAVQVMNEVLGGGFSSRMFSTVRSEKGLAYTVFGQIGAGFEYPGLTVAGVQTKSETMAEAVDAVLEELRGMVERPATAEELARAKDSILNSFVFNYASAGQVLGQQMLYSYYGLPLDFLEQYRTRIEQVSEQDVARVAEKYLHPDDVTLLVVGNAADFDRPLSAFGEVREIDISIPPPPSSAPELEVTEESLAAGRALLTEVVAALGGSDPAAMQSIRLESEIVLSMGGQSMAMTQTTLQEFPHRTYVSMTLPMGTQEMVMDGDQGFVRAGGQIEDMPAEQLAERQQERIRDLYGLAHFHGHPELEAVAAGSEEIDGVSYRILAVSLWGGDTRLWVGADGRVFKQRYQSTHPFTQAPGEFELIYSDYRAIGGGWTLPFVESMAIDGQPFAEITHQSVEIDVMVDPELFEKPAA